MTTNWLLFRIYFMASGFTFSGGMAMLPVIERELCDRRHLITKAALYEYTTLSQSLPGVIAVTNACFVGRKINGRAGMLAAGIGAVLPAFTLMLAATAAYQQIPRAGVWLAVMQAIRAASAAFLFTAAYRLAKYNLTDPVAIGLAAFCLLATVLGLLTTPLLIVAAGAIGLIAYRPRKEANR
ncbi:chromate transporter [Lacticaseibacillus parakribbianus]|uniref:chromate transporter n=1 Tax=Lacticaseibacillus parakribbianus TaxID=2970927 RepID=UPI0021CB1910|nr:chromate transporter [Lacticaseibacillus parakribbianus]